MSLFGLAARNVLRNRTRFTLTVLGLAVSVLTFITLETALRSWDKAREIARRDRLVTRHKVTFILGLPKRYVEEIATAKDERGAPLFAATTYASWFGGRDPNHENDFFASMAVDPETYFTVYDEARVDPEALAAFKRDRNAAIVGDQLAAKFGWKRGDTVTLETPLYPAPEERPFTFTIAGTYTTAEHGGNRQSFFLRWDRLNDTLPPDLQDQVGWIASRTAGEGSAAAVAERIDAKFADRDVMTLSQDELAFTSGFLGMVSAVLDVIGILAIVILAITGLILANAIGMSVRERTAEYAALKAIGFRAKHLVSLIVAEGAILALAGAAAGVGFSLVLVNQGLGVFLEQNLGNMFPVFRVDAVTVAFAGAAALGLGVISSLLPAAGASRIPVVDALRRVA